MKIELAQIYGANRFRINQTKFGEGFIILDIKEAEELWQELMVKCQEYRQNIIEDIEQ